MSLFKMFRQPYLNADTDMGGDAILPDDFVPEVTEKPAKAEPETPKADEAMKIKVKYNHQDIEMPIDEATLHIQKGMNYDKAVEKAKQEARDNYIAEQGYEWNGKPIKTETEYKQALKEQELQEQYKELPEDVAKELIESKKFRDQYNKEQETKQAEANKQKDQLDFLDYFKSENGRDFDTAKDTIPQSVWDEVNKGKSLTDAYAKHENQALRERLKKLEQNEKNDKKAPVGGVGTHGSKEEAEDDPFLKGFNSI